MVNTVFKLAAGFKLAAEFKLAAGFKLVAGFNINAVVTALALTLSGCGAESDDGSVRYTLTMVFSSLTANAGKNIYAALSRPNANIIEKSAIIAGPTVSIVMPQNLDEGGTYQVNAFIDVNNNGTCEGPGSEPGWVDTTPVVTGDITLTFDLVTTPQKNPCATFAQPIFLANIPRG
jgi:hypothetical protein